MSRDCTRALARHKVAFDGLSLALYEDTGDENRPLRLTSRLRGPKRRDSRGPRRENRRAARSRTLATTVVTSTPRQFRDAFGAIHEWIHQNGGTATCLDRELYIDCDGTPETWVTELQTALEPRR